jgi:creatinine amidohydrolase
MNSNILKDTMAEMTWPEIEEMVNQKAIVLIPVGVIEEHGPHLPHGTDIFVAYTQAHDVWEHLKKKNIASVIAPPFYWGGIKALTRQFPGTFTSRPETIVAIVNDILASLDRAGFLKAILFNSHGDDLHIKALHEALRESNQKLQLQTYWLEYEDDIKPHGLEEEQFVLPLSPVAFEEMFELQGETKDPFDIHAGAFETAVMRECYPEMIRENEICDLEPTLLHSDEQIRWNEGEPQDKYLISKGYVGDPASSKLVKSHLHDIDKKIAEDIARYFAL